jgi:thiol-disulfide isomerase/thioredoxin
MAAWVKGKIQFGDTFGRKTRLMVIASAILAIGWVLPFRVMTTIPKLIAAQNERNEYINDGKLLANSPELKQQIMLSPPTWNGADEIPWQHYDRSLAMRAVNEGYTLFVDYTADWCANCKTMLKTAIETPPVIAAMKELKVIPLTADYTSESAKIKEDLVRFKRAGVPVIAVYAPGKPDEPILLPEIITSKDVVDALKRAGPSKPVSAPITGRAQLSP